MNDVPVNSDAFDAFEAARDGEEASRGYDDFFGHITRRLVDPVLDAGEVGTEQRVLDTRHWPWLCRRQGRRAWRGGCRTDQSEAMLSIRVATIAGSTSRRQRRSASIP